MANVPYMEAQCLSLHLRFPCARAIPPSQFSLLAHGQRCGRPFALGQVVISQSSIDVGD